MPPVSIAEKHAKNCSSGSPQGPRIKRSRATPIRAAVLVGVHLLVAAHVAHYWLRGKTLSPLEPSESMEFSKHSIVNAGLVFFAVAILLTFVFGRFFCGWGCHIVALQDLCRALLLRVGIRPRPLRSRWLALVPLGAFLYMFIWPFAYRLWRTRFGDAFGSTSVQLGTNDFWRTFPGWGVALFTFAICGFAIVYLLGSKGFCTYACPYGAIFGLADRFAPGRIRVTDACEGCGHCTATCTSNVDVAREVREFGMVVDAGCMKCLDCVSVCPKDALYFGFGKPGVAARPRVERPTPRRYLPALEDLFGGLIFLAAFFSFRGLYGLVPFLLALGLAASLAGLYLVLIRVVRKQPASLPGLVLAQERKLTRAGRVYVVLLLAFLPFWAHSAFVQYESWRVQTLFEALAPARDTWFSPERSKDAGTSARFAALKTHAERAERFSLLPDARVTYALGWCALAGGDSRGFLDASSRAAAMGLEIPELYLVRAQIERELEDLTNAESDYRRALALHSHSVAAYSGLAELLARRGETDEAVKILRTALADNTDNPRLHHDLAVVHMLTGQAGKARYELEQALDLDPRFLEARVKLATLEAAAGHDASALGLLSEAARLEPDNRAAHMAVIELATALGDATALRRALDDALSHFPADPDLTARRAALEESSDH
jgi:Flp pilus assembly protein TadD/ferredoxin